VRLIWAAALVAFVISLSGIHAWMTKDLLPAQTDLVHVRGVITNVNYTYDKYHQHVTAIEFWLDRDPEFFYYPDFLPNFASAKVSIEPGAGADILSRRAKHEIWSLSVSGTNIADFEGVAAGYHKNGNWGLVVGVGMALAGIYLIRTTQTPSADPQ
jgi:hypothetical protein